MINVTSRSFAWTFLALSVAAPAAAWDCEFPPGPPEPAEANSCPGPQVSDSWDDGSFVDFLGGTRDGEYLDIGSAAFTTSGANLQITLTIRYLRVPGLGEDVPGTGAFWSVFFDYGDISYVVEANGESVLSETEPVTEIETVRYTAGPVPVESSLPNLPISGSFTPGHSGTIVFTVPLDRIGNPPAGAQLTNLHAETYRSLAGIGKSPRVDRAPNGDDSFGAAYTVGQVCIPPTP